MVYIYALCTFGVCLVNVVYFFCLGNTCITLVCICREGVGITNTKHIETLCWRSRRCVVLPTQDAEAHWGSGRCRFYICSDRTIGIIYTYFGYGYWGGDCILYTKQVVYGGSGLLSNLVCRRRRLPPLLVVASCGGRCSQWASCVFLKKQDVFLCVS